MGLDMYMTAKKRFDKVNWKALHGNAELSYDSPEAIYPQFQALLELTQLTDVSEDIYGATVEVTCAYWRKANQIHSWFVKEIQDGNDDCGEYCVSPDDLKELLALCKTSLELKDPTLLPPKEGFFFGDTGIDEWYWHGLDNTVKQLERILALPELEKLSLYYSSSW